MEYKRKNVWQDLSEEELQELESYNERYISFLSTAKTERLAVKEIVRQAEEKGFQNFEEAKANLKRGTKLYFVNKQKGVALFVLGEDLTEGMHIVGSHIDSPRLDLKANPLTEDGNLALFKTHYYGGIKKYQWSNMPLALHGVAYTKDGEKVEVSIGEDPSDPVFYINDLLPHLGKDQMKKNAGEVISGEQLQVVVGHNASGQDEDEKNPVKKNILKWLNDKYGLEERDFQTAEFEIVPAGPAREVGFDRAMIAGHGHDDRVCSFANLAGILDVENPKTTAVGLFVDKEEIGSVGNTGMTSKFFENCVAEILYAQGKTSHMDVRHAMANSKVLSGDVNVAFDPMFPDVTESDNVAYLGCGVALSKYTGSRGKGGSNDANAEFLQQVRKIFDDAGVIWQTGELGKVDQGGGGTIAYILAEYGAEVVDCGTGMTSMHAPIELVSKADAYETYRAYRAFFNAD